MTDGFSVYPMVRPVRTIPATAGDASFPAALKASTRTHLALVVAPGTAVGPTAVHVPLSGHNLLLTVDAEDDVVLKHIGVGQVSRSTFAVDGASIIHPHFMPPFSADFLDAVMRSIAAYSPLAAPDCEIDLDRRTVTFLDGAEATLPLRIAARSTASIVIAPITDARDLVSWTLHAELTCAGRAGRFSWDMLVTAQTGLTVVAGPNRDPDSRVHHLFPDHWHRGASRQDIASGEAAKHSVVPTPAAHASADGSAILRLPALEMMPEPDEARALRHRGDQHAVQGDMASARTDYALAADAGSAMAAYWLGFLVESDGDLEGAVHWYTVAAERNHLPALNDLATAHSRLGNLDEAERWYRRGMDAGDWTAASGLGALLLQRGDPEAETVLRMVAGTPASAAVEVIGDDLARSDQTAAITATENLASLLHERGQTDEAAALWEDAAEKGSAHAAYRLGRLRHDQCDRDEAERWWRTATTAGDKLRGRRLAINGPADSGQALAAYALGMNLLKRGDPEGRDLLALAAQAGHRGARYELDETPGEFRGWPDTDPISCAVRQDDWLVLPAPGWTTGPPVPTEAIVGGWALDTHGKPGPFQPNPHYVPDRKATPTDPLHALLLMIAFGRGSHLASRLLATLRDTVVEIACDDHNGILIGPAPDGTDCVAVVTAELHKRLLDDVHWIPVLGNDLPKAVPEGVDILLNPGDYAQFRLLTEALRSR
ncbi:type VII secretion system-associated protein [Actinokineospora soli]|uniref:Type VII secretion system-associated protein n=1 Tax=Actinokineospora soli TaxID=1048753 RepID=A0ABW2THT5_9PSEU